jgi:hypothetical protein
MSLKVLTLVPSSFAKKAAVDSTGERNGLCQCSSRGAVAKGLAWASVEFQRN